MKNRIYLFVGIVAIIAVIMLLVVYNNQQQTTPSTSTGIISTLSISRAPALNETAEITLSVITPRTFGPNVPVQIRLPDGFELVDGNPEGYEYLNGDIIWEPVVKENEELQLRATIKAVKVGEWTIFGGAPGEGDYLYISVSEDSAYINEKAFPTPPRGKQYMVPMGSGEISEPAERSYTGTPEEPAE